MSDEKLSNWIQYPLLSNKSSPAASLCNVDFSSCAIPTEDSAFLPPPMRGQLNNPAQYPWGLLVVAAILQTIVCYPVNGTTTAFLRKWAIAPIAISILVYGLMQGKQLPAGDSTAHTIGCDLMIQLLYFSNIIYIQGSSIMSLRRVKDNGIPPEKLPLTTKFWWMIDLAWNRRRVGWVGEPVNSLPERPAKSVTKSQFIKTGLIWIAIHIILRDFLSTYMAGNPSFDPRVHIHSDGMDAYVHRLSILRRIPEVACWAYAGILATISMPQIIFSMMSVAVGFSKPSEWPGMFGSIVDMYSIRTFWGRFWHQVIRQTFSDWGKFVANRLLGFAPGSLASSYTQLFTAFFLSGAIHHLADNMVTSHFKSTAMGFFLLQAVGICFEDFIIWCAKKQGINFPMVGRYLGYIWVLGWFSITAPYWMDGMFARGVHFVNPGPISSAILSLLR